MFLNLCSYLNGHHNELSLEQTLMCFGAKPLSGRLPGEVL